MYAPFIERKQNSLRRLGNRLVVITKETTAGISRRHLNERHYNQIDHIFYHEEPPPFVQSIPVNEASREKNITGVPTVTPEAHAFEMMPHIGEEFALVFDWFAYK